MSFELPTQRKAVAVHGRWPGAAFIVEAMLLLVFVMASLAVFTQMFAASSEKANESKNLTDAVAAASSVAEQFAAAPTQVPLETRRGNLLVTCYVQHEVREGGILYHATVSVYEDSGSVPQAADAARPEPALSTLEGNSSAPGRGEPIYTIATAKYESGV